MSINFNLLNISKLNQKNIYKKYVYELTSKYNISYYNRVLAFNLLTELVSLETSNNLDVELKRKKKLRGKKFITISKKEIKKEIEKLHIGKLNKKKIFSFLNSLFDGEIHFKVFKNQRLTKTTEKYHIIFGTMDDSCYYLTEKAVHFLLAKECNRDIDFVLNSMDSVVDENKDLIFKIKLYTFFKSEKVDLKDIFYFIYHENIEKAQRNKRDYLIKVLEANGIAWYEKESKETADRYIIRKLRFSLKSIFTNDMISHIFELIKLNIKKSCKITKEIAKRLNKFIGWFKWKTKTKQWQVLTYDVFKDLKNFENNRVFFACIIVKKINRAII